MNELDVKDYNDAINVQDACNLSGVVHSWAKVLEKMSGMDTEERNHHPINVMFSSKVADLTGSERGYKFSDAYTACRAAAGR